MLNRIMSGDGLRAARGGDESPRPPSGRLVAALAVASVSGLLTFSAGAAELDKSADALSFLPDHLRTAVTIADEVAPEGVRAIAINRQSEMSYGDQAAAQGAVFGLDEADLKNHFKKDAGVSALNRRAESATYSAVEYGDGEKLGVILSFKNGEKSMAAVLERKYEGEAPPEVEREYGGEKSLTWAALHELGHHIDGWSRAQEFMEAYGELRKQGSGVNAASPAGEQAAYAVKFVEHTERLRDMEIFADAYAVVRGVAMEGDTEYGDVLVGYRNQGSDLAAAPGIATMAYAHATQSEVSEAVSVMDYVLADGGLKSAFMDFGEKEIAQFVRGIVDGWAGPGASPQVDAMVDRLTEEGLISQIGLRGRVGYGQDSALYDYAQEHAPQVIENGGWLYAAMPKNEYRQSLGEAPSRAALADHLRKGAYGPSPFEDELHKAPLGDGSVTVKSDGSSFVYDDGGHLMWFAVNGDEPQLTEAGAEAGFDVERFAREGALTASGEPTPN